jgi:hypothetical protein
MVVGQALQLVCGAGIGWLGARWFIAAWRSPGRADIDSIWSWAAQEQVAAFRLIGCALLFVLGCVLVASAF